MKHPISNIGLVAGIVLYLSKANNIIDVIQLGVAYGKAATLNPGTELCKKEDVDNLYHVIKKNRHLV
jgi:6-phosphofructokinase 2